VGTLSAFAVLLLACGRTRALAVAEPAAEEWSGVIPLAVPLGTGMALRVGADGEMCALGYVDPVVNGYGMVLSEPLFATIVARSGSPSSVHVMELPDAPQFEAGDCRAGGSSAAVLWSSVPGPVSTLTTIVARWDSEGALRWTRTVPGSLAGMGHGATIDEDENVLVVEAEPVGGINRAYVMKLTPAGDVSWLRYVAGGSLELDSTVLGVTTDSERNVYVAGTIRLAGQVDPRQRVGREAEHPFVAKYGPNGDLAWFTEMEPDGRYFGRDVAVSRDGRVAIAGEFVFSGAVPSVAFLASFDPSGRLKWIRRTVSFATTQSFLNAVSFDESGGIWAVGNAPNPDFYGLDGGVIEHYDAAGGLMSSSRLAGNGALELHAVAVDERGNVLVTGRTGGPLGPQVPNAAAFVAKFAPTGELTGARAP
jgi:hypothetical protein